MAWPRRARLYVRSVTVCGKECVCLRKAEADKVIHLSGAAGNALNRASIEIEHKRHLSVITTLRKVKETPSPYQGCCLIFKENVTWQQRR